MTTKKKQPKKPLYVGFAVCSIDGKIFLDDKKVSDWASSEDYEFFQKSLSGFDAVVVGRNTFLASRKKLTRRNTYVFSSHVSPSDKLTGVKFVDPAKVRVAELFMGYTKVAVLGGGRVYQYMLDNHMLDEFYVTIEPLIFGRGGEMFTGGITTARFLLASVRRLNKEGTLLLHYKKP